ncbi:pilus assembly protein [Mesorhizobium sp. B2-3-11]|uniref:pilus assembly protein n=1 Tax=Mesorhizobium sp. B2-3-11 TaxID=2589953 RepID=UPI001126BFC2|nr:pilus assembly protein [Mesorhizobium sp. B2-3-11]TPM03764.1 pilus assembly protein [Mesorhizobium sp. B2-3-11]
MPSARNRTAAAVLGACLLMSGCADYMAHRDSVTLGLGDAPQANIGIQTINPFPPGAWNTRIGGDGRVVARAQQRYAPTAVVVPVPAVATTEAAATN